jgi:maltooligosyltrehalose trehalohydrolase
VAPGRTEFRVWAPRAERIALELEGTEHALADAGFGIYEAQVEAPAGARYRFVVGEVPLPDPCSRWQPDGLRGPSAVVDPGEFAWTDGPWQPPSLHDLVIYELHVGTFTAAGTFDAAIEHLPALRELGVTAIEVMPIAEFPGRRGWGYDGV